MMAPSFWEFLRERWGRLLLVIGCWTIIVFFVLPHLPQWAQWLTHTAVWCHLAYQWGKDSERERHYRAELDLRRERVQDIERYVLNLAEFRRELDAAWELAGGARAPAPKEGAPN